MKKTAATYINQFHDAFPKLPNVGFFALETACCSYKRGHKGTRYQLCYVDEQYDEIVRMMRDWPEHKDLWDKYLGARQSVFPATLLYENHRSDPHNDSPTAYLKSWTKALKECGRIPRVEAFVDNRPQRWAEPFDSIQ